MSVSCVSLSLTVPCTIPFFVVFSFLVGSSSSTIFSGFSVGLSCAKVEIQTPKNKAKSK